MFWGHILGPWVKDGSMSGYTWSLRHMLVLWCPLVALFGILEHVLGMPYVFGSEVLWKCRLLYAHFALPHSMRVPWAMKSSKWDCSKASSGKTNPLEHLHFPERLSVARASLEHCNLLGTSRRSLGPVLPFLSLFYKKWSRPRFWKNRWRGDEKSQPWAKIL